MAADGQQPPIGFTRSNSEHRMLGIGEGISPGHAGLARDLSQPLLRAWSTAASEQVWAGTPASNLQRGTSRPQLSLESLLPSTTPKHAIEELEPKLLQAHIEDFVKRQIANTLNRDDTEVMLNRSKKSVVKIFVRSVYRNPMEPWVGATPSGGSGSGFAFELGERKFIMTNAHVVGSIHARVQVEVEKYGDSRKYLGNVVAQGNLDDYGYDLAVIDVPDESFWAGVVIQPLTSDSVPELMSKVVASGYPIGGDGLCNTIGVVSRIVTDPSSHLLQIQVDAAINPGNSGGPVFDREGTIVGISVAKLALASASNIGYIIPLPVVQTFLRKLLELLKNCAETETGLKNRTFYVPNPSVVGFTFQLLENPRLREKLGMSAEQSGVLFIPQTRPHLNFYDKSLKEGDVILMINGSRVGNDGTVAFHLNREERVTLYHQITRVAAGEDLEFTVLRGGIEVVEKTQAKVYDDTQILRPLSFKSVYCAIGGLVFIPYTAYTPAALVDRYLANLDDIYKSDKRKEIVFLGSILPAAQVNEGADVLRGSVLISFNGESIQCLEHLQVMVDAVMDAAGKGKEGTSTEMDFRFDAGYMFVLDAMDCLQVEPMLCRFFGLPRMAWCKQPDATSE